MFRMCSLGLVLGLGGCTAVALAADTGTATGSEASRITVPTVAATPVAAPVNADHPVTLPDISEVPTAKPTPVIPAPEPIPARPAAQEPAATTAIPYPDTALPLAPRYTLRRDFGNGVGYASGYTYLEGFVPLWQTPGQSVTFANARVINYDNAKYWETQLGLGTRHRWNDTILGLNGFYDGRNTNLRYYHQLGFGLEALREKWEFRSNFYFPLGNTRTLAGDSGAFNPQFVGTNISLDRMLTYETAMRGFNVEAGRVLPSCCDALRTYAYLGYYHYDAANVPSMDGIRGRLESWVNERFSMNLAVQHDRVNNTTVTGGLSLHFGGVAKGSRSGNELAAKLGNRVVRDPNIVLQNTTENRKELAIDPATGAPIQVRHVESYAVAGGDGSVEHPYQSLAQLQTGSGPNMILFAHAGSVFNNQFIALQPNQRFLGEGTIHYFTAQQGTFLLPRATANSGLPIIQNTVVSNEVVRLANDTEVAGFDIRRAGVDGIKNAVQGTSYLVSNVLIRDNIITNAGGDAIELDNAVGNVVIRNNVIAWNGAIRGNEGIDIFLGGNNRGNYQILNNTITRPDDSGILVFAQNNAVFNSLVQGNTIDRAVFGNQGAVRDAILYQFSNAASGRGQILGNTITDSRGVAASGAGIHLQFTNNAVSPQSAFQIARNSISATNANPNGIFLESLTPRGNAAFQVFANNTHTKNIRYVQTGSAVFQVEAGTSMNNTANSFTSSGTITTIPFGSLGFPAP